MSLILLLPALLAAWMTLVPYVVFWRLHSVLYSLEGMAVTVRRQSCFGDEISIRNLAPRANNHNKTLEQHQQSMIRTHSCIAVYLGMRNSTTSYACFSTAP